MKISIKNDTKTVSVDITNESDIYDLMEELSGLLVAYGFHPESVKRGFLTKVEEYEGEDG